SARALDSEDFRSAQRAAGHFWGSLYSQSGGTRPPKIAGAATGRPGGRARMTRHGGDDVRRATNAIGTKVGSSDGRIVNAESFSGAPGALGLLGAGGFIPWPVLLPPRPPSLSST